MKILVPPPILAAVLLAGCASIPTGPSVMVLPGAGKSFEQFKADDAECRQWAAQQAGITTEEASTQSTATGAAIGTLVGAAAGAAIGAAAGNPGVGAAAGAGAGLLGGMAIGASRAEAAYGSVQHRYDVAHMQCMYAKGNQIPVARSSLPASDASRRAAAPPGAPPPPPPGPSSSAVPENIPPPPPGVPPPPPPGPFR